jgi:1-aminocyclopropane-1-carboxylate deaminase
VTLAANVKQTPLTTKMLFDNGNITVEKMSSALLSSRNVTLNILRLDKIHPVVSGNKLFKLHYFLSEALLQSHKSIVTFGGAYSNHLAATAFACNALQIPCKAFVRGERPIKLSHTLNSCLESGMLLEFISREEYALKASLPLFVEDSIVIPEGGYHPLGAKGASLIVDLIEPAITHICTATGTATTLAGLLLKASKTQQVVSIPVLKGFTDTAQRLQFLTGKSHYENLVVWDEYHFNGYAKKNTALLQFMNEVYEQFTIPTDFVYTAKMLYGILDQVKKGSFKEGSNIVCLHTGGLQGNLSLPAGSLIF